SCVGRGPIEDSPRCRPWPPIRDICMVIPSFASERRRRPRRPGGPGWRPQQRQLLQLRRQVARLPQRRSRRQRQPRPRRQGARLPPRRSRRQPRPQRQGARLPPRRSQRQPRPRRQGARRLPPRRSRRQPRPPRQGARLPPRRSRRQPRPQRQGARLPPRRSQRQPRPRRQGARLPPRRSQRQPRPPRQGARLPPRRSRRRPRQRQPRTRRQGTGLQRRRRQRRRELPRPRPRPRRPRRSTARSPWRRMGGDDESEGFSILEGLSALEDEEAQEERDAVDDDLGVELTGWPEGGSVVDRVRSEAEKIRLEHSEALQQGRRKGHETVLLHASMQFLFPSYLRNPDGRFNGTYVDLTFGRGGHSREILRRLSPHGRLVAFDVDHTAQVHGLALAAQDPRFTFVMRPFAEVAEVMRGTVVHGVMLDIGVSNPQLDDYSRGFSMNHLGRRTLPFDLRMNPRGGVSASEWLAGVTVEDEGLAWVFREYAGTRVNDNPDDGNLVAERMAQAIIDEQEANGPYKTINRFAEVVGKLILVARGDLKDTEGFEHTARGKEHPAKMWVAAIRTFLNDEAMQLEAVLPAAMESLAVGGRCLIAVFKPGEAEAVRQFALAHAEPPPSEAARLTGRRLRELYPLAGTSADFSCQLVVRGLRPSGQEVTVNNRARSGALWVLEKAARTLPRVKARPRPAKSRFKMPPRPLLGDGLPDRPDLQLF
ncbi:unnamed protein product, partial [Prorocentrum cordatum]